MADFSIFFFYYSCSASCMMALATEYLIRKGGFLILLSITEAAISAAVINL